METSTLLFFNDAVGSPQTVALSGTSAPQLEVSPNSLGFSVARVGTLSDVKGTVTVVNHQSTAVSLLIGINAPFLVASTTCGRNLAPFASCSAVVRFKPIAVGPVIGALTVSASPDAASPHVVNLSGRGR